MGFAVEVQTHKMVWLAVVLLAVTMQTLGRNLIRWIKSKVANEQVFFDRINNDSF